MTATAARSINLVTEIPGPRSRELLARREAAVVAGLGKATPWPSPTPVAPLCTT